MNRRLWPTTLPWLAGFAGSLALFGLGPRGLLGRLFAWIPGDQGDASLNNWILERNLQLVLQCPEWWNINRFFTTNSFWPESNTLAWSDNWILLTPIYGLLRLISPPGQSFSLLIALCLTCNLAACHRLCRHATLRSGYRLIAACLSGFSLTILARLGHAQLMPAFAGILAIDCLLASLERTEESSEISVNINRVSQGLLWLLLQIGLGFYQGLFFMLAYLCLFSTLILNRWIGTIKAVRLGRLEAGANKWASLKLAGCTLLFGLDSLIYKQYYLFSREAGPRPWDEVASMIPKVWSYGFNTLSNVSTVSLPAPVQAINIENYPGAFWEHSLFPGYAFTLVLGLGLLLGAKNWIRGQSLWPWRLSLLSQTCLLMVIVSLGFGGRHQLLSAWFFLYQWMPGFSALRAVSRIGLPLVLLIAPILAWTLSQLHQRLGRRQMSTCLAGLLVLYLAGNLITPGIPRFASRPYAKRFEKISKRVEQITVGKDCNAFYISAPSSSDQPTAIDLQLMAMWASLRTGKPTASGYSGHIPNNGWTTHMSQGELQAWLMNSGLDSAAIQQVCWIDGNAI